VIKWWAKNVNIFLTAKKKMMKTPDIREFLRKSNFWKFGKFFR
jgi:hypothetical protein